MPMRSAMAAAHTSSQRLKGQRGSQRPWVKNHAISTTTDTAHSTPMVDLRYPKASRYSEKNT